MRPFFTGPLGIVAFFFFEIIFMMLAWTGKMGNDALIVVALFANIMFAFVVFLNPIVILGLAGTAAGAATLPGGQTPTQAATWAVDLYLRVTQGSSHASTLLIASLFLLDYQFSWWSFFGMGVLLLAWGQYALTFPGPSPWPRRVALGILLTVTIGAVAVSLSPSVAKFITGRPFWSGVEYKETAIAEQTMGKNDADMNKESIQKVTAAIKKYRVRNDAELDRHVGSTFSANDLALFRATRDGKWNTLPKIGVNGAKTVINATPGIMGSPQFIPWVVGILIAILVIIALWRGQGVRVGMTTLALLVVGSLLWSKTRNEFWYGVVWPEITGEAVIPYTTAIGPTAIPVSIPDGAYRVRVEITDGANYGVRCGTDFRGYTVLGFPQPNGTIRGNSGELRVNGGANGEFAYIKGGTVTVTLSTPNGGLGGCAVETPVHPNILLTPRA